MNRTKKLFVYLGEHNPDWAEVGPLLSSHTPQGPDKTIDDVLLVPVVQTLYTQNAHAYTCIQEVLRITETEDWPVFPLEIENLHDRFDSRGRVITREEHAKFDWTIQINQRDEK